MKKNLKHVYYRHPRTRAEARANQEGWERPCRRLRNLPDAYDDLYPCHEKSWKAKRKTQYRPDGRGKEHQILVDAKQYYEWDLADYFKEHDIPYRIEYVKGTHLCRAPKWKRVLVGKEPSYTVMRYKKDGITHWAMRLNGYHDTWKWVQDGWEWRNYTVIKEYKITWWYDKDIGIDYILKQCPLRRTYPLF